MIKCFFRADNLGHVVSFLSQLETNITGSVLTDPKNKNILVVADTTKTVNELYDIIEGLEHRQTIRESFQILTKTPLKTPNKNLKRIGFKTEILKNAFDFLALAGDNLLDGFIYTTVHDLVCNEFIITFQTNKSVTELHEILEAFEFSRIRETLRELKEVEA